MPGENDAVAKSIRISELEAVGEDIDALEAANIEGLAADEERRLARRSADKDAYSGPLYNALVEAIAAAAMTLAVGPFLQGFLGEAGKDAFGVLKRAAQRRTSQTEGVVVRNAKGSSHRWEVLDSLPDEVRIVFLRDDQSGSVFEINNRVTVEALRQLANPAEVARRKPGGLYRWKKGRWRRARYT